MQRTILYYVAASLVLSLSASLHAGDAVAPDTTATTGTEDFSPPPSHITAEYELDTDNSYVSPARTNFGPGVQGNVSELETNDRLVIGLQKSADSPIFRLGLNYDRYDFGFSKAAPLPNILQAENLVLGADFTLFDSWLVRVEADPGLYDDARTTSFRNFNVPFSLGGSYIASEEVQWVAGLEVDINRQFPVIPAVGVRWALNDTWVINAVLPAPRLEYNYSKALTLFVGGDLDDGTYRVDWRLGNGLKRPKLSGAVVEYDEIRLGAGMSWKASKALTFELEAGYLPYREFDYHRADTHFSNDDGATYGRLSLNAQF
jgi:hypothetical protein